MTRSHTRSYSGGIVPCSGNATETETCCANPILSISLQECYQGCSSSLTGQHPFQGQGVFADNVPETSYDHWWMGELGGASKLRIAFSCPKTISSVRMRNSGKQSAPGMSQPER